MPPVTALHVAFGNAIRRRRKKLRVTQDDMAYRCGLHRAYYGQVERGKVNLSLANQEKIADGLGTTLSRLFASAERELQRSPAADSPSATRSRS